MWAARKKRAIPASGCALAHIQWVGRKERVPAWESAAWAKRAAAGCGGGTGDARCFKVRPPILTGSAKSPAGRGPRGYPSVPSPLCWSLAVKARSVEGRAGGLQAAGCSNGRPYGRPRTVIFRPPNRTLLKLGPAYEAYTPQVTKQPSANLRLADFHQQAGDCEAPEYEVRYTSP